jgi:hypothetical protein
MTVVVAASLALPVLAQGPVARIGALQLPDPFVNTTTINNDGVGNTIVKFQQCEVRSLGAGLYRICATVHFAATPATCSLITGTLDMTVSPPVWAPSQDVAAFNQTGTGVDEYQLSMSQDGLNAVWDRYVATTYPNSGAAAYTFVCHRNSTAVPFNINDIRAVTGVGIGGVDPHIGEELPNGHVILYHIDFLVTNNQIVKADLDPVTGVLGPVSTVVSYTGPLPTGFNHSPFVHRDSTGAARALNFSTNVAAGASHAYFTEGVNDDGTPEKILDGQIPLARWFNNPGLVGGSWHYTTSGVTEPQLQEVTMVANTTLVGGNGRIASWAPARPLPGSGTFISVIGIGIDVGSLSLPPYQIPPVINDFWIYPTLGVTDIRIHDPYNGRAEWVFNNTPLFNMTLTMQMVTLDTLNSQIHASNTALFNF